MQAENISVFQLLTELVSGRGQIVSGLGLLISMLIYKPCRRLSKAAKSKSSQVQSGQVETSHSRPRLAALRRSESIE